MGTGAILALAGYGRLPKLECVVCDRIACPTQVTTLDRDLALCHSCEEQIEIKETVEALIKTTSLCYDIIHLIESYLPSQPHVECERCFLFASEWRLFCES